MDQFFFCCHALTLHAFVGFGKSLGDLSSYDKFNKYSSTTRTVERAEIISAEKAHVFVAMPFMKEMDDVFYYGIQQPVHCAGFLCERVDQDAFTGDILDRVKKKIETAVLVIAE